MLESGVILLFLTPGVAVYAAVYGLFHSGKSIAPAPPHANSLEAIAVILFGALAVHIASLGLSELNGWICGYLCCPIPVSDTVLHPYRAVWDTVEKPAEYSARILGLLSIGLIQGIAGYLIVRKWLEYLARRDRLPHWIYGWAVEIANAVDNDDTLIIAYVLTTIDINSKTVAYGGMLGDVALKSDGSVTRITLLECDRYLVDLTSADNPQGVGQPLSNFPLMIIDAPNIRNISFSVYEFGSTAT